MNAFWISSFILSLNNYYGRDTSFQQAQVQQIPLNALRYDMNA